MSRGRVREDTRVGAGREGKARERKAVAMKNFYTMNVEIFF